MERRTFDRRMRRERNAPIGRSALPGHEPLPHSFKRSGPEWLRPASDYFPLIAPSICFLTFSRLNDPGDWLGG
jgi:hypothetical protein